MRVLNESKAYASAIIIMLIAIFFGTITVTAADFDTTVSINPSDQTVSLQETFTINIYCEPGQPIKSFEFKLSFDSSLLQVNSVTEGDIFAGYTTFFNPGIIDNNAGSVINIYGLILESGNISNPGTLVDISITAKSTIGTSTLNLFDVGVTNETEYVSIAVDDGSVTVTTNDPILSNPNPANESTNVPISTGSLSINIQNPDGDTFDYAITTSPDIGNSSGSEASNGSKSCSISSLEYSTTYTWDVSCMDIGSGNWTNRSYWFTTKSAGGGGYPGGGGGLPPGGGDSNDTLEQNNPPETPVKPSGPTFIEMGVEFTYTSSTYDIDGDEIRYRFDWGDGNYSNWSNFMSSNTSVSMSHHWSSISNYSVRVMAQDENSMNSSWSPVLNVTVSQAGPGEIPPVADINVSSNALVNQTIVFDASGSYDMDGVIVSYQWDFGDGETGTGVNSEHVYKKPGEYTVTLIVTDNNGNTYSKTIIVNVASEAGEERDSLPFYFGIGAIGFALIILVCLAVFFRNNIISFILTRQIKKLDMKIEKIRRAR